MKIRLVSVAILVALAVAFGACGGSKGSTTTSPTLVGTGSPAAATAAFPVTIKDDKGVEVTITSPPERIVALAPSFVEVLFALGSGGAIVAADENTDYPAEAASIPKISGFQPSVEAIASYEPDLVLVCCSDPGGVIDALKALEINVMFLAGPETIEGALAQIETLGQASGHATESEHLVAQMRQKIDAIKGALPVGADGPRIYHELDNTYYSAGPGSFIHDLYATLGAKNIAEATGQPFPQLSAEAIISADPEVIILADEFAGESPDTVAARPGWSQISAVKNGRVFTIDPNIVSRPGPRLVDALEMLERLLYP